jgi:hypothetical protein
MGSLIIDQNWLLVDEANIRKRGLGVKKKIPQDIIQGKDYPLSKWSQT